MKTMLVTLITLFLSAALAIARKLDAFLIT